MWMNKKKSLRWLYWPLLFTVIFLPLALAEPSAEDPPQKQPATEPASTEIQTQTPAAQVPATQIPLQQTSSMPMPPKQGTAGKLSGFTPTEEIAADSAVSFPVDI